jgi:hypothetical protein
MEANRIIENALKNNDEIRLVLEIAARARENEGRTPPMELTPSSEVAALPNQRQCSF